MAPYTAHEVYGPRDVHASAVGDADQWGTLSHPHFNVHEHAFFTIASTRYEFRSTSASANASFAGLWLMDGEFTVKQKKNTTAGGDGGGEEVPVANKVGFAGAFRRTHSIQML